MMYFVLRHRIPWKKVRTISKLASGDSKSKWLGRWKRIRWFSELEWGRVSHLAREMFHQWKNSNLTMTCGHHWGGSIMHKMNSNAAHQTHQCVLILSINHNARAQFCYHREARVGTSGHQIEADLFVLKTMASKLSIQFSRIERYYLYNSTVYHLYIQFITYNWFSKSSCRLSVPLPDIKSEMSCVKCKLPTLLASIMKFGS